MDSWALADKDSTDYVIEVLKARITRLEYHRAVAAMDIKYRPSLLRRIEKHDRRIDALQAAIEILGGKA